MGHGVQRIQDSWNLFQLSSQAGVALAGLQVPHGMICELEKWTPNVAMSCQIMPGSEMPRQD